MISHFILLQNKQGKLILQINTFKGILRELVALSTLSTPSTSLHFECFLEKSKTESFLPISPLSLKPLKPYILYLRLTEILKRNCNNYKFSMEFLAKALGQKFNQQCELKKTVKALKARVKGVIFNRIDMKNLHLINNQEEVYKLNSCFDTFHFNSPHIEFFFSYLRLRKQGN